MKTNDFVASIMSSQVVSLDRYASFSELRKLLENNDIHHIPIVEDKKLIGILSSTDVLRNSFGTFKVGQDETLDKLLDRNLSLNSIMNRQVITVNPDTSINEAAEVLLYSNFNCLPVVDNGGMLVGIITTKDVVGYLLNKAKS